MFREHLLLERVDPLQGHQGRCGEGLVSGALCFWMAVPGCAEARPPLPRSLGNVPTAAQMSLEEPQLRLCREPRTAGHCEEGKQGKGTQR